MVDQWQDRSDPWRGQRDPERARPESWRGQPAPWRGQPDHWQGRPDPRQGQPAPWQGRPDPRRGRPDHWQGESDHWQERPAPWQERSGSLPPGYRGGAGVQERSRRGGVSRRRGRGVSRRGRVVRRVLASLGVVVLVGVVAGAWVYVRLNGNIRAAALFSGVSGNAGVEKPDAFGHTPINLLVIGSDARANATDCHLGGGCGSGTSMAGSNADVEMLVHVSADRSNATVMSIPRDTMTQLPACRDQATHASTPAVFGMINGALAYGPGCQVAAVHQLTGVPIDHFVMVDFSGVVAMADAVGGVNVCVSDNVYDSYSHLKLAKGSHTLTGVAALQFVRSRHGFGDGSDLGRTYAQHLYLSALVRAMKSAGTLANPAKVYALADAATRALTVDTGLGSITSLVGLAADVEKVPANRITFTTMQTDPDPANPNRLVPAASAQPLFQTIINDQPLTTTHTPATSPSPSSASTSPNPGTGTGVDKATLTVRVLNGTGITGRAAAVAATLTRNGYSPATTIASAPQPAATTTLDYPPGHLADAQTVATTLDLPTTHLHQTTRTALTLTIGTDWTTGTHYPTTSTPTVDTRKALTGAHVQTADQSTTCAPVSHQKTVVVDHIAMTPIQAYTYTTLHARLPDSAP
jgi:LCP family protein required for cell wall assembly